MTAPDAAHEAHNRIHLPGGFYFEPTHHRLGPMWILRSPTDEALGHWREGDMREFLAAIEAAGKSPSQVDEGHAS